jgi:hypothetical protein
MKWLAKNNIDVLVRRIGPFSSALLLLLLLAGCLYGGYRLGNYYHGFHVQTIKMQKQRLDAFYAQQVQQSRRIHILEAELEFERLANQGSQRNLKQIESEHYGVKKRLAFYEKVMAPEKQADGLVIDSVSINSTLSLQHYSFEIVLIQQQIKKRYAKGYVSLTLLGSQNNKPSKMKISDISPLTRKDLTFSFQYFQVITGQFTLPDNFIAEKVEISAELPKGKWQEYSRTDQVYAWSDLISKDPSPLR